MSTQASAVAKVTFIPRLGSFTTLITASCGDLHQFYSGEGANIRYMPDYAALAAADKPVITFLWWSSRGSGAGSYSLVSTTWTFNGEDISNFPTLFSVVDSLNIKLIGNPGAVTGNISGVLKCDAVIQTASSGQVTLHHQIAISVSRGSTDAYYVRIVSNANEVFPNVFYIDSKDEDSPGYQCNIKAQVYQSTGDITTGHGVTYKWYKQDPTQGSGWRQVSTAAQIHVTNADVDGWTQYKLEAYINDTLIGFDVQEILDYSDPLRIDIAYNPESATIDESLSNTQEVTITPVVRYADTGAQNTAYTQFLFKALDWAGNPLNADPATPKDSFKVTYAMALQCGGDVRVVIETTGS